MRRLEVHPTLYRSAQSTMVHRNQQKLLSKTSWYKWWGSKDTKRKSDLGGKGPRKSRKVDGGDKLEVSSVMFVPRTREGELADRLREQEEVISKQ